VPLLPLLALLGAPAPVAQADWLDRLIVSFCDLFGGNGFFSFPFLVRGLLAVVIVSLICGAIGSLVVGNRMAFFRDALAHCAFAGIALGFLSAYFFGVLGRMENFYDWALPIMIGFGVLVGLAIAYLRETTSLGSDTVIGVFFAGAMGFGAMLLQGISRVGLRYLSPEEFLFGAVNNVRAEDLKLLFFLGALTALVLAVLYNDLLFTSFNPSLARTRRVRVRLCSYLFIALLAVIINICLLTVGALLINALLVVPAAAAANLCRNLRQMFWATVGLCLAAGAGGHLLAFHVRVPIAGAGKTIEFGSGGTIVVLCVLAFFLSLPLRRVLTRWRRRRLPPPPPHEPSHGQGSQPAPAAPSS
jgi:zinc transport system permease protein